MDITKNIKWISLAVLLFALGHFMVKSTASHLAIDGASFHEELSLLNLLALALYFVCGLLASFLCKNRYVAIGAVTGLLSAITAILLFNVAVNDVSGKIITLGTGLVLGALGGAFAILLRRGRSNAL